MIVNLVLNLNKMTTKWTINHVVFVQEDSVQRAERWLTDAHARLLPPLRRSEKANPYGTLAS